MSCWSRSAGVPASTRSGLEALGLQDGKSVEVDEQLRVPGHEWLYVIGDANGRVLLTHMGKYQGRLAADHILGRSVPLRSDGRLSPRVIFTEPQVAAVGHTLASAREVGLNRREPVDTPTEGSAGGSFVGRDAPGTARIVVDEDRRVIVGATFTGVEVAESLHAATIAVIGEVSARAPLARGAVLPHTQRAVAEPVGRVRPLVEKEGPGSRPAAGSPPSQCAEKISSVPLS